MNCAKCNKILKIKPGPDSFFWVNETDDKAEVFHAECATEKDGYERLPAPSPDFVVPLVKKIDDYHPSVKKEVMGLLSWYVPYVAAFFLLWHEIHKLGAQGYDPVIMIGCAGVIFFTGRMSK